MLKEMDLNEFRESGLLWMINQQLHIFGVALTMEFEDGKPIRLYPAECKFRGFDEKTNDNGYKKVSQYILDNADRLLKECD